jgi:hypothetical protein
MKTHILIIIQLAVWLPNIYSQTTVNNLKLTQKNFSGTMEVPNFSKEIKSTLWYEKQTLLWQKEIKSNVKDASSWFNYYNAQRYSYFSTTSKEITETEQSNLDNIITAMGEYVSSSFEYNYLKYENGNNNTDLFPYLEKAYKAEPANSETWDDFVAYYEMTFNAVKKEEFCNKLEAGNIFETDIINYNQNVLLTLEKDAIIFTNGTNDTYPLWILQAKTRTDVTILNIDLLKNKDYLTTKFKALGLTGDSAAQLTNNPKYFYEYITRKNPGKLLYFALTIPKTDLALINKNLYVTGVAYKYSAADIDNLTLLKDCWENTLNTSNLFIDENHFTALGYTSIVNKINMNYMMPMFSLYKKYLEDGEKTKAEGILKDALILGKRVGKESAVETYFKNN